MRPVVPSGWIDPEVRWRINEDVADGWSVTYRRQHPAWASRSGTKGGRFLYERAIPACDGAAAYFRIEYDISQKERFDPRARCGSMSRWEAQSVGAGSYLSADAFRFDETDITLVASVNDLEPNADLVAALKKAAGQSR